MTAQRFREFKMPDVGEGLHEAEILHWYVSRGDPVSDGMPVCEIETAKATVEIPIPYSGMVHEIHFAEGSTVVIGTPIITVDTAPQPGHASPVSAPDTAPGEPGPETGPPLLVGYGVTGHAPARRARRRPVPATPADRRVLAKPPVRKLARDLGVDLRDVVPSGTGGMITRADVRRAGERSPEPEPPPRDSAPIPTPGERRIPVRGVRRAMAEAMVASAFSAPHVTEFITLDVTPTTELVERLRRDPDFAGLRVTPLLLVLKAFLVAIRRHPDINASWDDAAREIVIKDAVNLGVAVATPRGLVVPHIKDAQSKTLPQLAEELRSLVEEAREGRTPPGAMTGGTITVTNIGVFGVDAGTPILNPGEAAILAVGAIKTRPWVCGDRVVPRQVVTLALSFDHRLVDGQLGSAVLSATAAVLERPERLMTWS